MLYLDALLLVLTGTVLICSVITGTPGSFRDPPRHVLICAAHSDDCVIMGAEYAYGAIQNGFSVRIAYLTCSGPHPDAEISRTRKAEALAAWSTLGVPVENLTFVNLSQTKLGGFPRYSSQDIAYAKDTFTTLILSLPQNAAVIVPAQGESHVDHRTVRQVSLHAIVDSKRDDLLVYESPEYNTFLSLVRCPERTIRTVLRHVPLLNRFVEAYVGPPGYIDGPPGLVFRDSPKRLAMKKDLLTYFPSQDQELLWQFSRYETPYRRLALSDFVSERNRSFFVAAFGARYDLSALALEITLLCVVFLTARVAARSLTAALSLVFAADKWFAVFGTLIACVYFVRVVRRTVGLESSLYAWAVALALIVSAL